MKCVKMAVMISATMFLMARTGSAQHLFNVRLSGKITAAISGNMKTHTFANGGLVADCTNDSTAKLVWDTSGGTNRLVVVDHAGSELCMKAVLTTAPGSLQTVVKGNVTEHAFYATFIGDNGSSGALFCHLKQVVTTKGTNLMGTCTGVLMNDVSEPGTLAVTLTSVFKPKP